MLTAVWKRFFPALSFSTSWNVLSWMFKPIHAEEQRDELGRLEGEIAQGVAEPSRILAGIIATEILRHPESIKHSSHKRYKQHIHRHDFRVEVIELPDEFEISWENDVVAFKMTRARGNRFHGDIRTYMSEEMVIDELEVRAIDKTNDFQFKGVEVEAIKKALSKSFELKLKRDALEAETKRQHQACDLIESRLTRTTVPHQRDGDYERVELTIRSERVAMLVSENLRDELRHRAEETALHKAVRHGAYGTKAFDEILEFEYEYQLRRHIEQQHFREKEAERVRLGGRPARLNPDTQSAIDKGVKAALEDMRRDRRAMNRNRLHVKKTWG